MTHKSKKEKITSQGIGRRDFIRKSALVCCMMKIPFVGNSFSKDDGPELAGEEVNPVELAAYCGLYCGACDIYQKRISQAGSELKKVLDAMDFSEISPQVPGLEDYETFYKVLNTLIAFFGQCVNCQKGGGNPYCEIRTCCREKGFKTCAECPSLPCDKIKVILDGYPLASESLKEIQSIGLEKWCQKEQEKVNKGFRYSDIQHQKKKTEQK